MFTPANGAGELKYVTREDEDSLKTLTLQKFLFFATLVKKLYPSIKMQTLMQMHCKNALKIHFFKFPGLLTFKHPKHLQTSFP